MNEPAQASIEVKGADCFRKMLQTQFEGLHSQLLNVSSKISRKEVHSLRVLSRHLRASFAVLEYLQGNEWAETFMGRLRQLTRILGPVRSCDVSEKILRLRLASVAEANAALLQDALVMLEKRRKKTRRDFMRDLKRFEILKLGKVKKHREILDEIDLESLEKAVERKEQKASMRLLKSWHRFRQKTSMSRLHALRIDLKKWRYLLEIKEKCLGINLQNNLSQLRFLQNHLGDIHDIEVLWEHLSQPDLQAVKKKARSAWKELLAQLESEMDKKMADFYNEGEKYLVQLLPLRSI